MIGLDINILVSAHRDEDLYHRQSLGLLRRFSDEGTPFALFWPAFYGFLRTVTHHKIFSPPSSMEQALAAVQALLALPNARVAVETERHAEILHRILLESGATGNLIYDAHLVALALENGVDEILTFDGDFARFPQVRSRHPFRNRG